VVDEGRRVSRVRSTELVIEGYRADVTQKEIVVRAIGRGYDQRDERAYEVALKVPAKDAPRVAQLLTDAAAAAAEMSP
jgi:hypothetical protein